jgi:hypothetical protein
MLSDILQRNDLEDLSRSFHLNYKLYGKTRGRAESNTDIRGHAEKGEFMT